MITMHDAIHLLRRSRDMLKKHRQKVIDRANEPGEATGEDCDAYEALLADITATLKAAGVEL